MEPSNTAGWEWSPDEIRRVGYRVADLVADYLTKLPHGPVFRPFPAERAAEFLNAPPPRQGQPAEDILDQFAEQIAPHPFGNGHPRFWGWVTGTGTPLGMLADFLASGMNSFGYMRVPSG